MNIIRELYLNRENRNLLNEFMKYLDRRIRSNFSISILGLKFICDNCFKYKTITYQPGCNNHKGFYFCEKCRIEHFDKYSKYESTFGSIHTKGITLGFSHICDIYKYQSILQKTLRGSSYKDFQNLSYEGYVSPSSIYFLK